MRRRDILAGATATGALAALPLRAQDAQSGPAADGLVAEPPTIVQTRPGFAPAGEIHVDPNYFSLYWTLEGDRAIRYKVGIGRVGLYEAGEFFIGAKKEWPSWTPTDDMIERNPELYAQWKDGMPGGPENPLGARALYLFTEERGDTFLRIHGTNAPGTIGQSVSNGCARLVNPQAIDLYNRVPIGARCVLYDRA